MSTESFTDYTAYGRKSSTRKDIRDTMWRTGGGSRFHNQYRRVSNSDNSLWVRFSSSGISGNSLWKLFLYFWKLCGNKQKKSVKPQQNGVSLWTQQKVVGQHTFAKTNRFPQGDSQNELWPESWLLLLCDVTAFFNTLSAICFGILNFYL